MKSTPIIEIGILPRQVPSILISPGFHRVYHCGTSSGSQYNFFWIERIELVRTTNVRCSHRFQGYASSSYEYDDLDSALLASRVASSCAAGTRRSGGRPRAGVRATPHRTAGHVHI